MTVMTSKSILLGDALAGELNGSQNRFMIMQTVVDPRSYLLHYTMKQTISNDEILRELLLLHHN
jgi:hypothetical protein